MGSSDVASFEFIYPRLNRAIWFLATFLMPFLIFNEALANSNSGIAYHGRILKSDGSPLEGTAVQFKLQILSPGAESCLLYSEIQTLNMANSSGVFSISINDGSGIRSDSSGIPFVSVFSNRNAFTLPVGTCAIGAVYAPNAADNRNFVVAFKDESMQAFEMLPTQAVNFSPMALQALSVAGFGPNNLLRVDDVTAAANTTPLNNAQYTSLMAVANGTAPYLNSSATGGAVLPILTAAPATPASGALWFNSSSGSLQYYNGTTTQSLGLSSGSGTVTSIGTGTGLTGGPITTAGTISLATFGTAGTYYKVVTDATGRVASGSTTLIASDIPNLTIAGSVSGSAITSGTIAGSTAINSSGAINTTGNIAGGNVSASSLSGNSLLLYNTGNTHKITVTAPALTADYSLVFPLTAGASGYVLSTDGLGNLSWIAPASASLSSGQSGILPIANGGTGTATGSITGSGSLGFAAGGTNQNVTITPSGTGYTLLGGYVGIGTPSPGNLLEVQGGGATAATEYDLLKVDSTSGNNGLSFGYYENAAGTAVQEARIRTTASVPLAIGTTNQRQALYILDSNAAVGVGTTSPATRLEVSYLNNNPPGSSGTASNANLRISSSSTGEVLDIGVMGGSNPIGAWLQSTSASGLNSNNSLVLNPNGGNIGIGTTSPSVSFDLGTKTDALRLPNGTTAQEPATALAGMIRYNTSTPGIEFYNGSAWTTLSTSGASSFSGVTNISDSTGSITLAPQSSTGAVVVNSGTPSTSSSTGAVQISGGEGVSGAIYAGTSINAGSSVTAANSVISPQIYGSTAANGNIKIDGTSNATVGNILLASAGGSVGVGTTSPGNALSVINSANSQLRLGTNNSFYWDIGRNSGASGRFSFSNNSNGEVVSILNGGSIGLGGVTAPLSMLDVPGGVAIGGSYAGASAAPANGIIIQGNVGIGTTSPQDLLDVEQTSTMTATGVYPLIHSYLVVSPSTASSAQPVAVDANIYSSSSNNLGYMYGARSDAMYDGSATMTVLQGTRTVAETGTSATGTVAGAYGIDSLVRTASGSSTITNAYGLRSTLANSATVTNWYGLYVDQVSGTAPTTSRYGIYVKDSGNNYFAGNVGVGTTSPTSKFAVNDTPTDPGSGAVVTETVNQFVAPIASSTSTFLGFSESSSTSASIPTSTMRGSQSQVANIGTGTVGTAAGVVGYAQNTSTGTVTTSYGGFFAPSNTSTGSVGAGVAVYGQVINSSTGTINNAYGVQSSIANYGGGTITNGYGLWLGTIATTNKWSVYASDATAPSYFAGNVGIGTMSPNATLAVNGHFSNVGAAATVGSCGTTPTILGNDARGMVTVGSGGLTSCLITFASAYSSTPFCIATWNGATPPTAIISGTAATGTYTVYFSSSVSAGSFSYHCMQ